MLLLVPRPSTVPEEVNQDKYLVLRRTTIEKCEQEEVERTRGAFFVLLLRPLDSEQTDEHEACIVVAARAAVDHTSRFLASPSTTWRSQAVLLTDSCFFLFALLLFFVSHHFEQVAPAPPGSTQQQQQQLVSALEKALKQVSTKYRSCLADFRFPPVYAETINRLCAS